MAGLAVARQHPRGRDGTVFVTIEDETGDVQVIVWRDLFSQAAQGAGQPGGGGLRAGFEMGRHDERDCDGRSRSPVGRVHAARPRLALRRAAGCPSMERRSDNTVSATPAASTVT